MLFKRFFPICLIIMLYVVGCGSSSSKVSNTTSAIGEKVPFVMLLENPSKNQACSDRALVCKFDMSSRKVSFEEKPLFERSANGQFNFRMVWDGNKNVLLKATPFRGSTIKLSSLNSDYNIKELPLSQSSDPLVIKDPSGTFTVYTDKSQLIVEASGKKRVINLPELYKTIIPYPLLVFGDENNYQVLVTFNTPSAETKGLIVGKLLLAKVTDKGINWQQVTGEYCSFIADEGASVAKFDDQIYITACGTVKTLDLKKEKLVLEDYKPINDILSTIKQKFQEAPIQLSFGVYKDYLLFTAQSSQEKWLWIMNKGALVGRIHIDSVNNRIESHVGQQSSLETLPGKPTFDMLILPTSLYGTYK